jgi:hypothetical protein
MKEGPDIAHVATLIGDPARANMLTALMSGKALTVSELRKRPVLRSRQPAHIFPSSMQAVCCDRANRDGISISLSPTTK